MWCSYCNWYREAESSDKTMHIKRCISACRRWGWIQQSSQFAQPTMHSRQLLVPLPAMQCNCHLTNMTLYCLMMEARCVNNFMGHFPQWSLQWLYHLGHSENFHGWNFKTDCCNGSGSDSLPSGLWLKEHSYHSSHLIPRPYFVWTECVVKQPSSL